VIVASIGLVDSEIAWADLMTAEGMVRILLKP